MSRIMEQLDCVQSERVMIHAVLKSDVAERMGAPCHDVIRRRLKLINVGDLSVAASDIAGSGREYDALEHQIRFHTTIVNELHRTIDILPFRFGVFLSPHEIENVLRENSTWYRSCLGSIAGWTELNLRWAVRNEPAMVNANHNLINGSLPSRGHDYLSSKLRSKQTGSRIEEDLKLLCEAFQQRFPMDDMKWQSSVGKLKVMSQQNSNDDYLVARIELLVPKQKAQNILGAASGLLLRSEKPTVASGPWPPYSFLESGDIGSFSRPMQRCAITFPNEAVS